VGWIVGTIAEIPKSEMISMRVGGRIASASTSGAQAPAPTATGDHPYQQKNAIAISEMGPATNNLPPTRGSEEVGDGTMSEVRGQPGVSGAHASVRAEGSGAAAGGGGEAAAAGAVTKKAVTEIPVTENHKPSHLLFVRFRG
jgi:hypothetical protein